MNKKPTPPTAAEVESFNLARDWLTARKERTQREAEMFFAAEAVANNLCAGYQPEHLDQIAAMRRYLRGRDDVAAAQSRMDTIDAQLEDARQRATTPTLLL